MDPLSSHSLLDEEQAQSAKKRISKAKIKSSVNWTRYLAVGGLVLNFGALGFAFYTLFTMMGVSANYYVGQALTTIAAPLVIFLAANIGFCLLLYQYSSNLKRFLDNSNSQTLSDFFDRQKVLWTVLGIASLLSIALYLLSYVVAMFV